MPRLVRPELAQDLAEAGGPRLGSMRLIATPAARIPPHGYHGRPSEISRHHGARLLQLAADRIIASIDVLLEHFDSS